MGKGMTVWVATVPLKYEIMAVAASQREAIMLASKKALVSLRESAKPFPVDADVNTWKKIEEYFGVFAVEVEVGSAVRVD